LIYMSSIIYVPPLAWGSWTPDGVGVFNITCTGCFV
jgi:hypothetical protein